MHLLIWSICCEENLDPKNCLKRNGTITVRMELGDVRIFSLSKFQKGSVIFKMKTSWQFLLYILPYSTWTRIRNRYIIHHIILQTHIIILHTKMSEKWLFVERKYQYTAHFLLLADFPEVMKKGGKLDFYFPNSLIWKIQACLKIES